jgi:hypothetical protein
MADEPFPLDDARLDDVVLALLWANSFKERWGGYSAWKSLPWDVLDRLHAKGLISDAHGHTRSVALSDAAHARGKALFEQWFAAVPTAAAPKRTSSRKAATKAAAGTAGDGTDPK